MEVPRDLCCYMSLINLDKSRYHIYYTGVYIHFKYRLISFRKKFSKKGKRENLNLNGEINAKFAKKKLRPM
jgi:hypothetical protein